MLYKPNYCCHCGEQVERIEWFPWTSRRFCEVCETKFKLQDRIPVIFAGFGILLGIFGFGAYLKSGEKELPVTVKQTTAKTLKSSANSSNQNTVSQAPANVQTLLTQTEAKSVGNQTKSVPPTQEAQPVQSRSEPKEIVYFCGAQTKKGTPCSRRVKGGGRCWQHFGQAAMLPPEKLVISQ